MYDDFFDYGGPSTGDLVYEEIKKVLLGTVKQEFLDELEKLRKENEELRPYKYERDRMRAELDTVRRDCERRIEAAEDNAKRLTLEELFGECIVEAWKVERRKVYVPKCDKCDDERKVHFKSPSGKELTEPCECDKYTTVFEPIPALLTRFKIYPKFPIVNQFRDSTFDKPVYYWYTTRCDSIINECEFQISDFSDVGTNRTVDNLPFKDLNEWYSVFHSKERCQEFCDYLTKKEAEKTV